MKNPPEPKTPISRGVVTGDNLRQLKFPEVTKIVTENNASPAEGGRAACDTLEIRCDCTTLAFAIRAARLGIGLSQAALGKAIGSNAATICRIEGSHQTPTLDTLERIARACGVRFVLVIGDSVNK